MLIIWANSNAERSSTTGIKGEVRRHMSSLGYDGITRGQLMELGAGADLALEPEENLMAWISCL